MVPSANPWAMKEQAYGRTNLYHKLPSRVVTRKQVSLLEVHQIMAFTLCYSTSLSKTTGWFGRINVLLLFSCKLCSESTKWFSNN